MSRIKSCSRFVIGCLTAAALVVVPPNAVLADDDLTAGQTAFNAGQYDDALKKFDSCVDAQPTSGDAHYWRAKCLAALGRAKEAGGEYRMALLFTTDNDVKTDCKAQLKQLNQPIPQGNVETALKTPKAFALETRRLDWRLDAGTSAHLQTILQGQDQELGSLIQGKQFSGGIAFPQAPGGRNFEAELANGPPHAGGISGEDRKDLSKSDVVLILDHSGSMGGRDCPSSNGQAEQRLLWAVEEMESFSRQLVSSLPHGFTFITYDTMPSVYDIRSEVQFDSVLNSLRAGGGTALTPALEQAYQRHSSHSDQPLLIAIISDCQIDIKNALNSMIDATQRYPLPNGVFFTFCQVGISAERYSQNLPPQLRMGSIQSLGHLRDLGAAYEASTLIPFSQLRQYGLANSILGLVRASRPTPPPPPPAVAPAKKKK